MMIKTPEHNLWSLACGLPAYFMISLLLVFHPLARAERPTGGERSEKKSTGIALNVNTKEPIFITSDRMEVDQKKNTITYLGHVITLQGEMTMKSDSLTAHYTQEMKQIEKVIAEGKVHVTQGDRVATGTKAVFSGKDQTITLTGNPVVHQGNSRVSGSRITFFMEQDRAVVEGGKQRVKAAIFPEELKKKKKGEVAPVKR
ncbi:MAG: lipopolysaccharide transport periplasmic protein LptA [Candidatus Binatia bacterium]